MTDQGKDLNELLQMWERDLAQYKVATGSDVDGAILVATVLEHLPDKYQPILRQVPMNHRETYDGFRAYLREWIIATRPHDDRGVAQHESVPMESRPN